MRHPLAWRSLTAITVPLLAVLLALSSRYGYHRDELYFRVLAEHPAWGYVDQPPLTPLLARASIAVFGDTLTALRVLPALSITVLVVLVALIARELGGRGAAQTLAALGTATGAFTLIAGHSLLTLSFDLPMWAGAIWFVLRALRGRPRWWLAAGAVIGLATYNKHLIAMLVLALAAGLLVAGPWRVLAERWLWAGTLVAVVVAAPNLIYQITHDWPQLTMAAALGANKGAEMRMLFVPMQFVLFGPVVAVIGAFGFVRLWRDRRVRALAAAYPAAAALTLVSGGRFDYTAGLILLLFAAGCVGVEAAGPGRVRSGAVSLAMNTLGCAVIALPLIPVGVLARTPVPAINEVAREAIGWPRLDDAVAGILRSLPPEDRSRAVIVTANYGEYGSLSRAGLPRVYSGHNQLWQYGPPPESGTVAIVMDIGPMRRDLQFTSCELRAEVDNGVGIDNEEQGVRIHLCRGLDQPWSTTWHRWRHFS